MYTRTAQVLADSIAEAQFETIDSPLTPANVKDVISAIRAKLDSLVTAGKLIGAECWYDVVDNSTTDCMSGACAYSLQIYARSAAGSMELYQTFTDEYFEPALQIWEVPDGCAKTSFTFTLFVDGENEDETHDAVTLPKLTRKTDSYRGGGMMGAVSIDLGLDDSALDARALSWGAQFVSCS